MTKLSKPFSTADIGGTTVDLVFGDAHHTEVESIYAQTAAGAIPFRGNRHKVKVTIETENIVEDNTVVGRGVVRFQLDGTQVYRYLFNQISEGLLRLPVVLEQLAGFGPLATSSWAVEDIQKHLIGRKVWYRDQPAVVEEFLGARGWVKLLPDGKEAFDPPAYLSQFGTDPSPMVDILSEDIWWYRSDES